MIKILFIILSMFFSANVFSMIKETKKQKKEYWNKFFCGQNPRSPNFNASPPAREDKSCRKEKEPEIGDLPFELVFED